MKKLTALFCLAAFGPCLYGQDKTDSVLPVTSADSMTAVASTNYHAYSFLHTALMGENYRKEWSLPVKLPVFYLSQSGFTIKELSGGKQTKSLRLTDRLGKEWALRTVDKNVTEAMPAALQHTMAQRASQDLISAAFPYGAPIAGELANAIGLPAARPQIFYVAEDPALGALNSIFANTICSLEERDPGFDKTDDSKTVVENLAKDHRYKIQQQQLLKARLLDMLMSDWDRHADNWRWGIKDSAGFLLYYPVPRDRDWAFYNSGGLLPKIMHLTGGMRHLVSFRENLSNSKSLNYKARAMDKIFLNELTANDWENTVVQLQQVLSDSAIKKAVMKMPASIYRLDGETFVTKLKSRRNGLKKEAMKYYRFLSADIIINGSDENESFVLSPAGDSLLLTIYTEAKQPIYRRAFSAETSSVTINGNGGNDSFEVTEEVASTIRIKLTGGDGMDFYDVRGTVRIKIYDSTAKENIIINKGQAKLYFR